MILYINCMASHEMIHEKCRAYEDKLEDKNPYIDILVNLILLLISLKNHVVTMTCKICDLCKYFNLANPMSLIIKWE